MKLAGLLGPQIRGQSSCEAVSFPSLPQGVNTTAGEGTGQVPHPLAPLDAQEGPPEDLPAGSGHVKQRDSVLGGCTAYTVDIPALSTGHGSMMDKKCQQNGVSPHFPPPPGQTSFFHPHSSHCARRSGIKDIITERQCQVQRGQQELSLQTQPAPCQLCLEHSLSLGLAHKPQTQPYTPECEEPAPHPGTGPLDMSQYPFGALSGHVWNETGRAGRGEPQLCILLPPASELLVTVQSQVHRNPQG